MRFKLLVVLLVGWFGIDALAEPPNINEVHKILAESGGACAALMSGQSVPLEGFHVLVAHKEQNRIAAMVALSTRPLEAGEVSLGDPVPTVGPIGIVELFPNNPGKCDLWYYPTDIIRSPLDDIFSSIEWGGRSKDGYLRDSDVRIIGWWNSGQKEFLVVEWHHGHESTAWYRLLLTAKGELVQWIESGYEHANEHQPWMDTEATYYCEPNLTKKGKITLTCTNHQQSKPPPFQTKVFCWNNNQLVECDK